jgi:S-adenosylmethionine:tRNA ribosyltransferase-isomerase
MFELSDYDFELPSTLIAQYPRENRTDSRLLCMNKMTGHLAHHVFPALIDYLQAGDLLVFNNTKVIPARLYGEKASGGRVEILIERILDDRHVLAHIRASKAPRSGSVLYIHGNGIFTVIEKNDHLYQLAFMLEDQTILDFLFAYGKIPLPPYITREAERLDTERYQTVYAKKEGSVAAPTAGLHFDDALIEQLKAKGIQTAEVTLHVGAGTFQPVKHDNIREHQIHHEWLEVSEVICEKIRETKARGSRVIAVGTTSVRSLETACVGINDIRAYRGETNLFIYPGYEFKIVDAMITNFHLPKSSLLMLVSAFAGFEGMKKAYQEAVSQQYQFFSYGDAMLIY